MMPLLSSFVVVTLAEMGDKTQLIALTLGLTGSDALMDPWTYTETDVRSIGALEYAYV